MRRFLSVSAAALLLSTATIAALGQGEGTKTALQDMMEEMGKTARTVLGGIITADMSKVQSQANQVAGAARRLRTMQPPKNAERSADFQVDADTLAARANRLVAAAKGNDTHRVSSAFGSMIDACMTCHAVFRKD